MKNENSQFNVVPLSKLPTEQVHSYESATAWLKKHHKRIKRFNYEETVAVTMGGNHKGPGFPFVSGETQYDRPELEEKNEEEYLAKKLSKKNEFPQQPNI